MKMIKYALFSLLSSATFASSLGVPLLGGTTGGTAGSNIDHVKVLALKNSLNLCNVPIETVDNFVDTVMHGKYFFAKHNVKKVLHDLFEAHQQVISLNQGELVNSNMFCSLLSNPTERIKIAVIASKIAKEITEIMLGVGQKIEGEVNIDRFETELQGQPANAISRVIGELSYAGAADKYVDDFSKLVQVLSDGVDLKQSAFEWTKPVRALKGYKISHEIALNNVQNYAKSVQDSPSENQIAIKQYFQNTETSSNSAFSNQKQEIATNKFTSIPNFFNWVGSWFITM